MLIGYCDEPSYELYNVIVLLIFLGYLNGN